MLRHACLELCCGHGLASMPFSANTCPCDMCTWKETNACMLCAMCPAGVRADLLRIMCQRVLKTSRSTAPPTSDSPSEQQGPAYLDCQPEEVDMVVTQICDALGKAGYYSPQVLQLLAKEVRACVCVCVCVCARARAAHICLTALALSMCLHGVRMLSV